MRFTKISIPPRASFWLYKSRRQLMFKVELSFRPQIVHNMRYIAVYFGFGSLQTKISIRHYFQKIRPKTPHKLKLISTALNSQALPGRFNSRTEYWCIQRELGSILTKDGYVKLFINPTDLKYSWAETLYMLYIHFVFQCSLLCKSATIVRTSEICRASHVTKNLKYPCAEIRVDINLEISVFLVRTTNSIYLKFYVDKLFNFDTGIFQIFGRVNCPANFRRADQSLLSLFITKSQPRIKFSNY